MKTIAKSILLELQSSIFRQGRERSCARVWFLIRIESGREELSSGSGDRGRARDPCLADAALLGDHGAWNFDRRLPHHQGGGHGHGQA